MSKPMRTNYAVYDKDDNLVMVGNYKECIEYMGITKDSFLRQIRTVKRGKESIRRKYTAYKIEESEYD